MAFLEDCSRKWQRPGISAKADRPNCRLPREEEVGRKKKDDVFEAPDCDLQISDGPIFCAPR